MAGCDRKGCTAEAGFLVVVVVPAKGWAFNVHTPLKLYTGVRVCRAHRAAWNDGPDFLPLEARERIRAEVASAGRAVPDFRRAGCQNLPLTDPAAIAFLAKVEQAKGAGS